MSHPTDFTPVPVPDPSPKAVTMELTIRIMHPGHLWKIPLPEYLHLVANRVAEETALHCGGAPTQQITVEVIPVRKGIDPVGVSGPIRDFVRAATDH